MRVQGAGNVFGMKLGADEERVVLQLYGLDQLPIRRRARDDQSRNLQLFSVFIVNFITMAMSFLDKIPCEVPRSIFSSTVFLIERLEQGVRFKNTWPRAKPDGATILFLFKVFYLVGHDVNNLVRSVWIRFGRICPGELGFVTRKFNDGHLHTKTKT